MAAAIWLVKVSNPGDPSKKLVNGIHSVVINADDLDSEATVIAEAETALQAAGQPIRDGYFDTADLALAAGQLDTDEDLIAYGKYREPIEVIA